MREGLYGLAASREMSLTIPSFPTQRILPGFTFAVEFTWKKKPNHRKKLRVSPGSDHSKQSIFVKPQCCRHETLFPVRLSFSVIVTNGSTARYCPVLRHEGGLYFQYLNVRGRISAVAAADSWS